MLKNVTVVFPLAVALFALFWFLRWAVIHRREPLGAPAPAGGRFFDRNDWIALGLVTVVYAVVAFAGLGSTSAPQSFLHFEDGNYYALIDLGAEREVTGLKYYTGLCTADYRLQVSTDGENWVEQEGEDGASAMPQGYAQLFRWCDATLGDNGPIRYLRIISGAEQYLGEIALYDADGALIPAEEFTVAAGCEQLVDEQDTVVDHYTYKNGTYFDEIYFPRTALEMIQQRWPYEITHPPLGKAIISVGIRLFGMTPFGWRFMGVLFGVLMLPALYVLIKKMFGDTAAAAGGTALFAFDFMHFTQTRLATIDTYAVFFTICMYLFMYFWLKEDPADKKRLLWLGLAGLSFGLGAASKWVCIYAGAGLAALWAIHWIERFVREKNGAVDAFLKNVLWCLLFFILVPGLVYFLSYYSYAPSQGITGPFRLFQKEYIQLVLDNQKYMWNYHSDLVATHPYSSKWYQWLLDIRPILYYLEYFGDGTKSAFGAFSNPLVCWGGLLAMGGMVWLVIRDRDRAAAFILIGYLANLLPWVLVSRLTFAYHYFPCTIFLVLAIARLLADLRERDARWKASVGSFAAVGVALFVMFYPVLSGARVSMRYTEHFLKWFADTWPF